MLECMRCQGIGIERGEKAEAWGLGFKSWLSPSQFCVTSGQLLNLSEPHSAVVRIKGDQRKGWQLPGRIQRQQGVWWDPLGEAAVTGVQHLVGVRRLCLTFWVLVPGKFCGI